jgi:hypothetical protein
MRKRVSAVLAVAAVGVGLTFPASSGADPLPDTCTKDRGTVNCKTQPGNSGDAASGQDSSTKTETQKGSLQSSHPNCTFPPPQGKCD